MAVLKKMIAANVKPPGAPTAKDYFFKSNPLTYASIATETGIALAPVGAKIIPHRIEDLLLGGALYRVAVTVGTTPTNRKTVRLYCTAEKLTTIEDALVGKTIPQGIIASVSADLKSENFLP